MVKKIIKFFDKIEDKIRSFLSRHPIIYAFIGGIGIVLFWRGVWHTADLFPFLNGPISIIISSVILLLTGLFVSFFIGHSIILSGLKQEKKIEEKEISEIETEMDILKKEKDLVNGIYSRLEKIEKTMIDIKSKIK
ncbi:MAG: hypothetical protein AAB464_00505 [Patescibacteria group bacterium]